MMNKWNEGMNKKKIIGRKERKKEYRNEEK